MEPPLRFPLVDDKVLTCAMAEKFGVPTPPIFRVIENHGEIAGIEEALGDRREFVLKPARGSGEAGLSSWSTAGRMGS